MRAKVLHLITELSNGGAQRALLRLVERLDPAQYQAVVACYYNGDSHLADQMRAAGIPVYDLGMGNRARVSGLWRLQQLLVHERPDILHTWMFHANVPGRVLGWVARVPAVISSERTMNQESATRRRLNRATAGLADRIVCVSQSVRTYAQQEIGLPADKLVVIPNGIDLASYTLRDAAMENAGARVANQPVRLISVGRLEHVKGVDTLIEAASLLARKQSDCPWLLTIVGDGSLRSALEANVLERGLASHITFLGDRQDVPALLAQNDLFVLASRAEGMPNAALEAMASGLPVVATTVGGTPEVVVDGATGLLTPPNDPAAFAGALATLLAQPAVAQRMGLAGRARVEEHFSLAATVRQTEDLYRELIGRSRA